MGRSTTTLVLFLAFIAFLEMLSPMQVLVSSAQEYGFPDWIRPGLHVAYSCLSASLAVSPWASMQATLGETGTIGGPVSVPEPTQGQVSSTGVYEHYVVERIDKRGVHMYFASWSIKRELGKIEYEILTPLKKPFNGPFWVDPRLLANARQGSTVNIPQEGKLLPYQVVFAGRYDISPFSNSEDSLTKMGVSVFLPVPEKTYRDVVGLRALIDVRVKEGGSITTKRMIHEMVVDKRTGLILMEALMEREPFTNQGGQQQEGGPKYKRSMYARYLAEVNMDFEDKLPSYREKDYDYGILVHTGYAVESNGMLIPPGGSALDSIIASYVLGVAAVYKNYAVLTRAIFVGIQPPFMRMYTDVVDLDTGRTLVVGYVDLLASTNMQTVGKTFSQGAFLVPRGVLGRGSIEIYGVPYRLIGSKDVSISGLGNVRIYAYASEEERATLAAAAYVETEKGGIIIALQPGGLPGYTFKQLTGSSGAGGSNILNYLSTVSDKIRESKNAPGWESIQSTTTNSSQQQGQQSSQSQPNTEQQNTATGGTPTPTTPATVTVTVTAPQTSEATTKTAAGAPSPASSPMQPQPASTGKPSASTTTSSATKPKTPLIDYALIAIVAVLAAIAGITLLSPRRRP